MRMTLVAIAVALLVAACSPDETAGTDATTGTDATSPTSSIVGSPPQFDGNGPRVGVLELPTTLNPIAPGGTLPSSTVIQRATLPGAYLHDPATWRIIPDLVVRIPTLDDGDVVLDRDRQRVTWTIDPEASWSDGIPVSGGDFAFTLKAALGLTDCGGSGNTETIFGIEIVDVQPKAVTVEMPGPSIAYESMFRAIIPAHATNEADVCTADGVGWPSAGPYRAVEMTADRVTVVTNPSYWRGSVGMDGALFVRYESASALTAAYKAGEIDLIVTEDAAMAETLAAAGAAVNTEPLGRIEHLAFNFAIGGGEGESFRRSVAFRQGIARAIDRDRLADLVGWVSVDGVQRGVIPSSPWSIYDHDVDEARRLVALTCSANGRNCDADPPRLRLIASAFGVRHRIVDQIAADLEEAGIEVEVRLLTSVAMARSVTRRDWDIAVLGISEHAGVAAAADSLFAALDTERDDNVYSYGGDGSLAATDRAAFQLRLLSGKFQESADRDAVSRLLSDAHGLLASDVVFVPLMARPQYTLVNENRLDGVVANATPSGVTWNIGDWVYTDE